MSQYHYTAPVYSGYSGYPQQAYAAPIGPVQTVPVVPGQYMQNYPVYPDPYYYSFGSRLRRFFGFAPANGVRFKGSHNTWGFMGYSRRQRYVDARTGGEVDRQGRPVYRV